MLRDLSDAWGWLQRIIRRIDRLESGAPLENASITNGRLRIIGGTLRVDSGGSLIVVGTMSIDGTTTVTGTFKVTGPWTLQGNGTITGNVTTTGELTQIGPWHLNGDGSISGDVDITGDLNLLADLIVSSLGRIKVGSMTLDPTSNGGSMKFAGGPEVYASGGELSLYSGIGSFVTLNGSSAKLNGPGAKWVEVTAGGFRLVGLPKVTKAGVPSGCLYKGSDGFLYEG
ncbi:hypothetical protein ABTZ44_07695 [Microbacterium oxydans]|uniref:hypothetical protein n=1 Tax=Microbacterium oxydans TaxID=82380 RepID=UPI003317E1E3